MKTVGVLTLMLLFAVEVFATPLTRREYERLDKLLQGLVQRGEGDHGDIHDDDTCRDATFGVLDYKCADFLRDVFHGELGTMCSSKYYQVHCCQTCSDS